jgi:hypothetical protein
MKKIFVALALSGLTMQAFSQDNLIVDGGFENLKAGTDTHLIRTHAAPRGKTGKWQLSIVSGACPDSCATGYSVIDNTVKNSGSNSLRVDITKQTNRNDVRLVQTLKGIAPAEYEITFYAKSSTDSPISLEVLNATLGSPTNGTAPYVTEFLASSTWKQFKFTVDISEWTDEELKEIRIALRPNSRKSTALPSGAYPKSFWIDDITLVKK